MPVKRGMKTVLKRVRSEAISIRKKATRTQAKAKSVIRLQNTLKKIVNTELKNVRKLMK